MTDCPHSALFKRTPIPGPTSGTMYACQECGEAFRVEPWGEIRQVEVAFGAKQSINEQGDDK